MKVNGKLNTLFRVVMIWCVMTFTGLSAYAWGPMGHDVVAAIAEQNLTRKAKKNISKLLDGKSIVYYASWMDSIQNSPYWEYGYNKTKTWHYANVDKGETYQTMPKNKDGDVVTGLTYVTKELTENYKNLTDSMRVDYLKMVIHMVGDMHCPMHAGRLSDRGGNDTKVKWFGEKTSMHSVWDSKMIESARRWGYQEWVEQLDRKDKKFIKEITKGTYEEWFMQTVSNAARFYEYVESLPGHNPNLSYKFVFDFSPTLEECLILGGYRLAYVLNTIFG